MHIVQFKYSTNIRLRSKIMVSTPWDWYSWILVIKSNRKLKYKKSQARYAPKRCSVKNVICVKKCYNIGS